MLLCKSGIKYRLRLLSTGPTPSSFLAGRRLSLGRGKEHLFLATSLKSVQCGDRFAWRRSVVLVDPSLYFCALQKSKSRGLEAQPKINSPSCKVLRIEMKPQARKRKEPTKYSENSLGLSDLEDDNEVEEAAPSERKVAKFMESDEEVFGEEDDGRPGIGGDEERRPISVPDAVSEATLAIAQEEEVVEKVVDFLENIYSEAAQVELLRVVTPGVPCQCGLEEPRCGEGCSNRRERRECSPSRGHGSCSNMVSSCFSLGGRLGHLGELRSDMILSRLVESIFPSQTLPPYPLPTS